MAAPISQECATCARTFTTTNTSGPPPLTCSETCRLSRHAARMRVFRAVAADRRAVARAEALRSVVLSIIAENA